MSRPTNPGAPTGGQPLQRQPALESETLPPGWPPPPPHPQSQTMPGWPPQPAPGQQGRPQAMPAADPYAAASYHYPQSAHSDTYAAPQPAHAQPPQPQYTQPRYAPPPPQPQAQPAPQYQQPQYQAARPAPPPRQQPDFAPQHQPQPPLQADPRAMPRPQHQAPPVATRSPAPAADLRGSLADQWPSQAMRAAPPQPQPDPRNYDLSAYAGPAQQQQPYAAPAARSGWPGQPEPAAPPAFAPAAAAVQQPGRAVVPETEYAHDEVYDDEPPRRSRGLMVVGALVGAIALGGGLAYAYKMFMAPSSSGKTPVVRADQSPTKTAPAVAGGKQFANQDIKVGGRVTDGASATGGGLSRSAAADDNGARRVPTTTFGRDGSVIPPASEPAPPPPGMMAMRDPLRSAPPGMSAPVLPPPGQRPATAPPPSAQPSPPPVASPTEPRTLTLTPPSAEARTTPPPVAKAPAPLPKVAAAPRAPAPAVAEEEPAPPPKKTPQPRASLATTAPAAAAPAKTSGFVAVLSSQRTSMDALKAFADLQQKYPPLQGRSPSVVEANIPDKGVYHRLVVGPPGPRDQATQLCSELKQAGYQGCWVTAQ